MLELEHCPGASLPSQPATPASILIRFAHRQLANSHPEPRVTCNEGHPPPVGRLPFAVLGSQALVQVRS
jgi:hypothetical protein